MIQGHLLRSVVVLALVLVTASDDASAQVPDKPSGVAALSWLTGAWEGPLGEQTLEEYWTPPRFGAISAVVRFRRDAALEMLELISITDSPEGLLLRLQQWSPDMTPRAPAQTLRAVASDAQFVMFEAISDGGLKTLGYRIDSDGRLQIEVGLAEGRLLKIRLERLRP